MPRVLRSVSGAPDCREDWQFVFGKAQMVGRVGVFSFARYTQEFHSLAPLPNSQVRLTQHYRELLQGGGASVEPMLCSPPPSGAMRRC